MSTTRPDHETLRGAIALAVRAPSVHNTQPWLFRLGESSVHLLADRSRALPATDPAGRDLLISCGAALHHLCVALAALGWSSEVHRIPNPADPDHLAALEPHRHHPSDEDIALAAAINHRRTDRRSFSSWPVPSEHLELLSRRAARHGALLIPVTDVRLHNHLVTAIDQAAAAQQADPACTAELATWAGRTRLADDGILATNTLTGPTFHGAVHMRDFPRGTLTESTEDAAEDDAGELLVLATPDDDPQSWLRAGEAASAALLTATELNLASCPLSQALEVANTRAVIQELVLDNDAVPQLILRVGWAHTAAAPLPQSPRRPVDEVIDPLPGLTSPPNER
ncbi:MAG TPA: nitroreductase family protein [Actinophytocola sp.]|uniref:Acg family FMN-binding oxidoreductase n=1 Tax=Actinophytocola sp. TaxID=1872138 RepID=UPI002DBAFBD5|nr:nitroreductase family protein [Actinophytocola sp.]HEU5469290.1 nitroreductase family protein [Actinophytocola sp.]